MDQEGQWYIESSGEQQEEDKEEQPGGEGGGLQIKAERMEEWLEEEEVPGGVKHSKLNHPVLPQVEEARIASPETTTTSSSGAGQNHDSSPGQDHRDGGGTEGPNSSVSTTGLD
ncbi:hypothetical protein NHX12_033003 [Muraenolepis orangiensis]|uniref:Uncharacterized protein n=1 Tax=Muraenolepis orangiensis TaxID=630683 RepID=A0A9Q0E1U7_9TELE|nr:hypothetical protein NHX12_033003 [Muraenolepis orangiensis]